MEETMELSIVKFHQPVRAGRRDETCIKSNKFEIMLNLVNGDIKIVCKATKIETFSSTANAQWWQRNNDFPLVDKKTKK